jgi:hypothetical protein
MDHSCEAVIVFVGSQGDAFELLELAEEVLDQVTPFVHLHVDGERCAAARMLGDDVFGAARIEIGEMVFASKALSAIKAPKATPSMSGGTPTVSKRCPGSSSKRTRLPNASVSAKILVVMPLLERPMAWREVPLLRPVRGGGP